MTAAVGTAPSTPGAAAASVSRTWPGRPFAGTGLLLRLALRRDRIIVPVSVLVLVATFGITLGTVSTAYGTQADRDMAAATLGTNAAFKILLGPLEHTQSVASMASWRIGLFMMIVAAALASMAVVRHTRKEEEAERLELVRAAPIGALAPLTAATVIGALLSLATGVGIAVVLAAVADAPGDLSGAIAAGVQVLALGLAATGIGAVCAQVATSSRTANTIGVGIAVVLAAVADAPGDLSGAIAAGVQVLALGLAATGISAVCAQVATSSRTANTIGVLVLVAGYALRGVADVRDGLGWLRWLTPVGWAQEMDPFGSNAYGPALLCLALAVVALGIAARLSVGRDVGAGLVQPHPGPADAPHLSSVGALARRLQSGVITSWALPVGAYCLLLGLILESADDIVGGNADAAKLIEQLGGSGRLQDVMTALILGWVGIVAAAFAVTFTMQLRTEEAAGRAEVQLTTGVSRARYLAVAAVVSVTGVVVILACAGILMGLGHGLTGGSWGPAFADAVGGAAVQIPAALVVAGLVLAIYAWWPRLVALGWAVITVVLLISILGDALNLPSWVLDLSPFTHTPRVPLDQATALPLIVLTLVAAAFFAAAFIGFRRRDVPSV